MLILMFLNLPAYVLAVGPDEGVDYNVWLSKQGTRNYDRYVKELLADGQREMNIWRYDKPMEKLKDIEAFINTFDFWTRLVRNNDANEQGAELKKAVRNIQIEKYPQLREAYANLALAASGLNSSEVEIAFKGAQNRTVNFIWTGKFSPPYLFSEKIYAFNRLYWSKLRFRSVNFYKQSSTGLVKLETFFPMEYRYAHFIKTDISEYDKADRCFIYGVDPNEFRYSYGTGKWLKATGIKDKTYTY